jgi:hypothetical protein
MKLELRQMRLEAIISGGQTGADRGGLDAARELGLKMGGYCPKGRRAEDGRIPDEYPMVELTDRGYIPRTRANIDAADVTIVFQWRKPSRFTATECLLRGADYLIVHLGDGDDEEWTDRVRAFLSAHDPRTINIAGNRESVSPGICDRVRRLLVAAIGPTR